MINQSMLDSLPFGILITDKNLRVTGINRWITDQRPVEVADCRGMLITDLFSEITDRGLQAIYELVLGSEQKITISNRIHKYFLKMPGRPGSDLDYMPQSTIVAPLFVENVLTGSITIITEVSERVITERILNREIDKLSTLHNVDQALAILDLDVCLDVIVSQTQTHFAAEGVAVFLAEDHRLRQAAGAGLPGVQTPAPNSLAAWCFENRKSKLVNYARADAGLAPLIPGAHAELAAPLIIGDGCLGVVQVSICLDRPLDKYDLELLEGLAARAAAAIQNARLHEESEYWRAYHQRVNGRLQTLLNAVRLMSKHAEMQEILNSVVKLLADVLHADLVIILRPDANPEDLIPAAVWGADDMPLLSCAVDQKLAHLFFPPNGKSKVCTSPDQLTYLSPACRESLRAAGLNRLMAVSLSVRDAFAGIVHVFSIDPAQEFGPEEQELFEAMAAQLSLAIENAELYALQQQLAVTDGLTGVFNRRRFDQELEIWIKRMQRSTHPLSLIILDIDNFKRFNDTFGHQTGDDVLKLLAATVSKNTRAVDIVARYGGEEFVVILPDTALDEAVHAAERLRVAVLDLLKTAENPLVRGETLTISLGVAAAPFHAQDAAGLVRAADGFLYAAKHAGKNRVVTSVEA